MNKQFVIIFDFDGTLANSETHIMRIFQKLAQKYLGRELSSDEMTRIRNENQLAMFKYFKISVFQIQRIISDIREELNKIIHFIKPYPGIKEVLLKLKNKRVTLGIVSSNNEENINIFLK